MDQMMPQMDGIEATKIVREMGINVPIIALTANVVEGSQKMFLAAGMNDFLAKPIIKASLINLLETWIPAEKIVKLDNQKEEAVPEDEPEADASKVFWEKIEQIEGLSVQIGLGRVSGQQDVYEMSLKLMINEIENCNKNLNESLRADDMRNFAIIAHSMKSSLANIGANDLSALALKLETAADKNDRSFCALKLPTFMERLSALQSGLAKAFAKNQNIGQIEIPPELPSIFEKMKTAFDEMNFSAIDGAIKNLDALNPNAALKEEIGRIKDAILMMDYDAAKEVMRKLTG
jgi:HPt (histidine-containing phosphotransfer) domain-containing protein